MNRVVVPADLPELLAAVARAVDGTGPAVAPRPPAHPGAELPEDTALVLRTSGSTGGPREVAVPRAALAASGAATHARLGGPGHWVLTLPADHVAGVQVVARAHAAGLGLTLSEPDTPFTADAFAALAARSVEAAGTARRYVSIVPTQLHRLVAAAETGRAAGLAALAGFDAVLVGGAATATALADRARSAGVRVVTTYGMTETCGGCVYDGRPLDGVEVRIDDGRIELGGAVVAAGYVGDPAATADAFVVRDRSDGASRWFRTSDVGRLLPDAAGPVLEVLGRLDDAITTGGVTVAPGPVEAVLGGLPGVGEACVVGVPDPEWGQAVVAIVTLSGVDGPAPRPDARALDALLAGTAQREAAERAPAAAPAPAALARAARERVAATLGRAAAPRRILVVRELPLRGPGKIDRAAAERLAAAGPVATTD